MDDNNVLHTLDASAIGVTVATLFGWLPNIAALLSVIYLLMRMYETYLSIRSKKYDRNDD